MIKGLTSKLCHFNPFQAFDFYQVHPDHPATKWFLRVQLKIFHFSVNLNNIIFLMTFLYLAKAVEPVNKQSELMCFCLTLFCLSALFSFMWGQSFPVSTALMSETATVRELMGVELQGNMHYVQCYSTDKRVLTFIHEHFKRNFTLRRFIQITIVKNLVI